MTEKQRHADEITPRERHCVIWDAAVAVPTVANVLRRRNYWFQTLAVGARRGGDWEMLTSVKAAYD